MQPEPGFLGLQTPSPALPIGRSLPLPDAADFAGSALTRLTYYDMEMKARESVAGRDGRGTGNSHPPPSIPGEGDPTGARHGRPGRPGQPLRNRRRLDRPAHRL